MLFLVFNKKEDLIDIVSAAEQSKYDKNVYIFIPSTDIPKFLEPSFENLEDFYDTDF